MTSLAERVSYDKWRGRNALDQELFIVGLRLHGRELSGWQMDSVHREESGKGVRRVASVWTPTNLSEPARVLLTVIECPSRDAAHESLLDLLSTQLEVEDYQFVDGIGDAALTRTGHDLMFARANLAIGVSSVGKKPVVVRDLAKRLDYLLTSREASLPFEIALRQEVQSSTVRAEADARQTIGRVNDSGLSLPSDPWYKFFAPAGRFFVEMGLLFWLPETEGDQPIVRVSVTG